MQFDDNREELEIQFECFQEIVKDAEYYKGDYDVIPTVDGVVLQTKDKYLEKDVNVKPIPHYETSNTSGGTTIYIASEVL